MSYSVWSMIVIVSWPQTVENNLVLFVSYSVWSMIVIVPWPQTVENNLVYL